MLRKQTKKKRYTVRGYSTRGYKIFLDIGSNIKSQNVTFRFLRQFLNLLYLTTIYTVSILITCSKSKWHVYTAYIHNNSSKPLLNSWIEGTSKVTNSGPLFLRSLNVFVQRTLFKYLVRNMRIENICRQKFLIEDSTEKQARPAAYILTRNARIQYSPESSVDSFSFMSCSQTLLKFVKYTSNP